jgi:hypothetical protein
LLEKGQDAVISGAATNLLWLAVTGPRCAMLSPKMDRKNQLYFRDNLRILREHVPDKTADPIYLDPPFKSNATYVHFVAPLYERRRRRSQTGAPKSGEGSAAQIHAFEGTWGGDLLPLTP